MKTVELLDSWKDRLKHRIYLLLFGKDDLIDILSDVLIQTRSFIERCKYRNKIEIKDMFYDEYYNVFRNLLGVYKQLYIDLDINRNEIIRLINKNKNIEEVINETIDDNKILETIFSLLLDNKIDDIWDVLTNLKEVTNVYN
jgi:hypothetical protein